MYRLPKVAVDFDSPVLLLATKFKLVLGRCTWHGMIPTAALPRDRSPAERRWELRSSEFSRQLLSTAWGDARVRRARYPSGDTSLLPYSVDHFKVTRTHVQCIECYYRPPSECWKGVSQLSRRREPRLKSQLILRTYLYL